MNHNIQPVFNERYQDLSEYCYQEQRPSYFASQEEQRIHHKRKGELGNSFHSKKTKTNNRRRENSYQNFNHMNQRNNVNKGVPMEIESSWNTSQSSNSLNSYHNRKGSEQSNISYSDTKNVYRLHQQRSTQKPLNCGEIKGANQYRKSMKLSEDNHFLQEKMFREFQARERNSKKESLKQNARRNRMSSHQDFPKSHYREESMQDDFYNNSSNFGFSNSYQQNEGNNIDENSRNYCHQHDEQQTQDFRRYRQEFSKTHSQNYYDEDCQKILPNSNSNQGPSKYRPQRSTAHHQQEPKKKIKVMKMTRKKLNRIKKRKMKEIALGYEKNLEITKKFRTLEQALNPNNNYDVCRILKINWFDGTYDSKGLSAMRLRTETSEIIDLSHKNLENVRFNQKSAKKL